MDELQFGFTKGKVTDGCNIYSQSYSYIHTPFSMEDGNLAWRRKIVGDAC